MEIKKFVKTLVFSTIVVGGLAGCSCSPTNPPVEGQFNFTIALESNKNSLEVGDTDNIVVRTNGINDAGKTYTYSVNNTAYATVGTPNGLSCPIEAVGEGKAIFVVTEETTKKRVNLPIEITSSYVLANGGYNFASSSGTEAIKNRTEILGALEKYAVESHLTGITLFENGGYVKYSSRLDIPTEDYITGYGFGILSEGNITDDIAGEENANYKRYYHSAQSSNPGKINAMDDTGSQVSDLSGYITSAFWGTKMNKDKNGYDWYPVLAKDTVNGKPFNRPIPVYEGAANPLGLYKKWKIYVKTGDDGAKYRYNGRLSGDWDNKPVSIDDYEFTLRMLLTGANQLVRGSEIAADKTYGIKGAQSFYNKTKSTDISYTQVKKYWNDMKADNQLGISTGSDSNGKYIELELINEIDDFTAMYTLSSNLYSPLSEDFVLMLGNGDVKDGAKIYGCAKEAFNTGSGTLKLTPNDTTLSLGAYYLEYWSDEYITFKQNDTWFERTTYPTRYRIPGVKITTYRDAQEDPDALYRAFYADALDSCGVPTQHITEEKNPSKTTEVGHKTTRTLVTKGDSTFKLNINSCTQERWDYLFGKTGKICVTDDANKYECKPWMSNENFLNGLYWSINRKVFAENRGVQPSIDYFSNAYLDDPEAGHSYNKTEAHKKAVKNMHNVTYDNDGNILTDDYGYNKDTAIAYFTKAYSELRNAGKIKDGQTIKITINWMYQNDINEYGNEIKKYFEDAFNDPKVCGNKVNLVVEQPNPSSDWQAVYNEIMMKGKFDLAFGAISGNTYNPLNFLEVLKSDNSSGFTLNWGNDTSAVDAKHPLVYKGMKFSFDALWQVADHGGIVENGCAVNSIKNCYMATPTTNNLYEGFTVDIPMEFVDVNDVELDVSKVALFVVNGETHDVNYTYDKANKVIKVTIPADVAASIDEEIKVAQKKTDPNKTGYIEHPFTRSYYNSYWYFELTYTLSIAKGTPSANTVAVAMTQDQQDYK